MTTVAYKDGVLASDSQLEDSETGICGSIKKISKVDNCLIGGCGNAELLSWFLNNFSGKIFNKVTHNPYTTIASRNSDEFQGIVISPRGKVFLLEGTLVPFEIKPMGGFIAIGAGASFAMGAMEAGASAEEAIRVASKFNSATGGRVQKVKL